MSKLSKLLRKWVGKPKPEKAKDLQKKSLPKKQGLIGNKPPVDPFLDLVDDFAGRCERWPVGAGGGGKRVGFLITPWISTAVPLLMLECARRLAEGGNSCVLMVDGTNLMQNAEDAAHLQKLEDLLLRHFSDFEVLRASDEQGVNDDVTDEDRNSALRLLRENAIWRARGETGADSVATDRFADEEMVAAHLARVRRIFERAELGQLLVPGGIFGLSGVYLAAARKAGVPFATFDGTNQILRLCQNGIAAHLEDIPAAFSELESGMEGCQLEIVAARAFAELDDRVHARDFRQFQLVSARGDETLAFDIVVPLNIRWDSAALGRQRAFPSVEDWLRALLDWVAARPRLKICLRQHPRERLAFARSGDDLAPLVAEYACLGDRLRYVRADEEVSTYDLLRQARVVLPHTSTVGIEAAMLGKAVVLSTACYYEGLGFCQAARNAGDYFDRLEKALTDGADPDERARQRAALAYHLTQNCAYVKTCFTAVPDDFRVWNHIPPEVLWEKPEMKDFQSSLVSRQPLSVIRHRRLIQGETSDKVSG